MFLGIVDSLRRRKWVEFGARLLLKDENEPIPDLMSTMSRESNPQVTLPVQWKFLLVAHIDVARRLTGHCPSRLISDDVGDLRPTR